MNEQHGGDPRIQVMSVKDWLVFWLVMLIPCVNLIMLIVWAVSSNGNENRRNYCIAYLIVIAVVVVLSIIISTVAGAAIAAALQGII